MPSAADSKIVGLSAALTALVVPAVLPATVEADVPQAQPAPNSLAAARMLKLVVGDDLMAFTVGENAAGIVVADHSSHASHASHASHSSHHSSR